MSFSLEPLHVLVVDDQPFIRLLVRRILRAIGIRHITEAEDGATALAHLHDTAIDLAIVDWEMEPVDGLKFIDRVRTPDASPNPYLPIIMLTAHTAAERVREARDAGANDIIAKPVSVETMYRRILSVIEHPRPFVRSGQYFGPDRRRRGAAEDYDGPLRRKTDAGETEPRGARGER